MNAPESKEPSAKSRDFVEWCKTNPIAIALLVAIAGTFFYFFGAIHLFVNGTETAARWAWNAWNPEQDQEHSKLVPFMFLGLIAYHWGELVKARKGSSKSGLAFIAIGLLFYLASTRCLEPRMALVSLPFIFYGSTLYVWGKEVGRIMLFPCAFLIFLIPFGAIQQLSFHLQYIVTDIASFLGNLVGVHNQAIGTTISGSANGGFRFEVAEGCSGIHSIIAITMLTSIYMHIAENVLWKKIVVFCSSVAFAIIGNIGRIFTILLVAKIFNANIASGPYHEYSGYLIYPFAILAMLGLSAVLNRLESKPGAESSNDETDEPGRRSSSHKPMRRKVTYDYDY
ncbi:MAG TPA: exosortase/archaeosortase family protein [Chthoniobacteraceae bacterium]|nr:exosortase/archaeosortase family protein [Chthoniobacteraceae bacterium]